jgi:hypothetical protein
VLREAGLTHTRAEGTHRHVSLRREEVDARFPGLLGAVLVAAEREAGGRSREALLQATEAAGEARSQGSPTAVPA